MQLYISLCKIILTQPQVVSSVYMQISIPKAETIAQLYCSFFNIDFQTLWWNIWFSDEKN